jgi:hypothetical protein
VTTPQPRGFAQASAAPEANGAASANRPAQSSRSMHLIESKRKTCVMIFSPIRAPSRFREPWKGLARRPSTTLSTRTVDKRKTASSSSAYRAFLQTAATSRAN